MSTDKEISRELEFVFSLFGDTHGSVQMRFREKRKKNDIFLSFSKREDEVHFEQEEATPEEARYI